MRRTGDDATSFPLWVHAVVQLKAGRRRDASWPSILARIRSVVQDKPSDVVEGLPPHPFCVKMFDIQSSVAQPVAPSLPDERPLRIVYLTAGAGGMICGSCLHDNTLARALIELGHDVQLVPLYTPIETDEPNVSRREVFFGGINLYLQQKFPLLRRLPKWLDHWLDHPWLIRWAAGRSVKIDPAEVADLTVSLLRGMEGHQRKEVERLAEWLSGDQRPDVLVFSNVLTAGCVPEIKRRMDVPVVVTLQGDDIYLDWLPAGHRETCLGLIRELTPHLDGFLTTSRYYADFMAQYLDLPREKIEVVYPGLSLSGFPSERGQRGDGTVTIGYLARICPEKGLHLLVEAFGLLRGRPDLPPLRLRAAGYCGERDRSYLYELQKKIEQQGWSEQFDYAGELSHQEKLDFLGGLDIFSVPTTYREPKGLYLLEAWACGVPAVQPAHGSFPELIERTGGGLLVEPSNAAALADGLERLIRDSQQRAQLGVAGRETVRARFHARRMAEETLAVLRRHSRQTA